MDRSPAEPEIQNPKPEIRNKFKLIEKGEREKRERQHFVTAHERLSQ